MTPDNTPLNHERSATFARFEARSAGGSPGWRERLSDALEAETERHHDEHREELDFINKLLEPHRDPFSDDPSSSPDARLSTHLARTRRRK